MDVYEIIDAKELARRLAVPWTWVKEGTRSRSADVIPHLKFGIYIRFEWNSPALNEWLARHRRPANSENRNHRPPNRKAPLRQQQRTTSAAAMAISVSLEEAARRTVKELTGSSRWIPGGGRPKVSTRSPAPSVQARAGDARHEKSPFLHKNTHACS